MGRSGGKVPSEIASFLTWDLGFNSCGMAFYIFDFLPYVFGIHVCELDAPLVPLLAFHYEKLSPDT